MSQSYSMSVIAHMRSPFPEKFGIPRQSGLTDVQSRIVFTPEFRNPDTIRDIEGFSHLWILWVFSEAAGSRWSPTVRPPRLGGNTRTGVFATRSPYRPNPIGMSAVRLDAVRIDPDDGPVLLVSGADLMDGTPILDIKPYLSYSDRIDATRDGFTETAPDLLLTVDFPPELLAQVPSGLRSQLLSVLSHDPRPAYQQDPDRIYGMGFGCQNIRFRVEGNCLTVLDVSDRV